LIAVRSECSKSLSILPLTQFLAHGGPVVACAASVANDLSFLMEFENHAFAATCFGPPDFGRLILGDCFQAKMPVRQL